MRRKNSYKNLNRKTFVTIFLQKPPISRQSNVLNSVHHVYTATKRLYTLTRHKHYYMHNLFMQKARTLHKEYVLLILQSVY